MGYSRTVSDSTKTAISNRMKQVWATRSEEDREKIRQKQSDTMRRIWNAVPKPAEDNRTAGNNW